MGLFNWFVTGLVFWVVAVLIFLGLGILFGGLIAIFAAAPMAAWIIVILFLLLTFIVLGFLVDKVGDFFES